MQAGPKLDAVSLWRCYIKARLKFCFHEATVNIDKFLELWRI